MRSIIGKPMAWNTSPQNPYTCYAMGVVEEGNQIPSLYASEDLAMNALMQTIIDEVLKNPNKTIVWRRLPKVDSITDSCLITGINTTWYKATARFCFEDTI